jgi:hypothetical protein
VTYREAIAIVAQCEFPGYEFQCQPSIHGLMFLHASFIAPCSMSGKEQVQKTREWLVPSGSSRSEIVATCFKCVLTSVEHETREAFKYDGAAIYQPHHDVDALRDLYAQEED